CSRPARPGNEGCLAVQPPHRASRPHCFACARARTLRLHHIDGFLWLCPGIVSYTESSLRGRELVRVMKGNEAMPQIIKSARRLSLSATWAAALVVACGRGGRGKEHGQTKSVGGCVEHGAAPRA